ncbi:cofilin, partial [Podila clonocystis]
SRTVVINERCLETFMGLKAGKYKYIIFGLSDNNQEVVVLKACESGTYDDFVAELPRTEPRYAVYDLKYEIENKGILSKIVFFAW